MSALRGVMLQNRMEASRPLTVFEWIAIFLCSVKAL